MLRKYPTIYSDRNGVEHTVIENDGHELRMTVRGVLFHGKSFDDFEPAEQLDLEALKSFSFQNSELCDCTIECDMPMSIVVKDRAVCGNLNVRFLLGAPLRDRGGGLDRENLIIELRFENHRFTSRGNSSGFFELELADIQSSLPEETYIKACINCAFSDYNPAGQAAFGGMACFRDCREAYQSVKSKSEIFAVWDKKTEFVQETYLCSEFERRKPGTGYRG